MTYALTDLGNSERLAEQNRDGLRHVEAWRSWVVWDGRRWARGGEGPAIEAAKLVVKSLQTEAAELSRNAADGVEGASLRASAVASWAHRSSSAKSIDAMVRLARTGALAASPDMFDEHPDLLNVQNGTIHLALGEMHPHSPADTITQLAPVAYDPTAAAPLWERFLERIQPDAEQRAWLQRFAGYSLTGHVREHCMTVSLGDGANGKSVYQNTIAGMLGDYAGNVSPEIVLTSPRGGDELSRRLRAELRGKRLVQLQEIQAGRRLNEAIVKQLTSDDLVTGARVYEAEQTFRPTHKLWLAANHRPGIAEQDEGIWRRIRLVQFPVTIPARQRDTELEAKLRAEWPGILAWAVRGAMEWYRYGLGACAAIDAATAEYRGDEDLLAQFLDACTERCDGAFTSTEDIADAYRRWSGVAISTPTLRAQLRARGYASDRRRIGSARPRGIVDVRLRTGWTGPRRDFPEVTDPAISN